MDRPISFLGIRRQNVWANIVFVSALAVLFVTAGGPLKVIEPWAESIRQPTNSLGGIEVTAEREYLSYGSRPKESEHLLFGLAEETAGDVTASASSLPEIEGAWLDAKVVDDCRSAPEFSIRLRTSGDAIFGYGLVAPTRCGSHRPEELDYTVVQGQQSNGAVVLTILEKAEGHMLYRFDGKLSGEGLVGRLVESDGDAVVDGLVFALDPTADGRL